MVSAADPDVVGLILEALRSERVIAIPTDTVYGLAADPKSMVAMNALFELKQRPKGVPVAVLAASVDQARSIVQPSARFEDLARLHWPGALTIVAPVANDALLCLGDTTNAAGVATVGVRVPDHELITACAAEFGPIAATSANVHGSPTIVDPSELRAAFGARLDVIVDGGELEGLASTVIDIGGAETTVLRQGMVQVD